MDRYNLGCGDNRLPGWINVDISPRANQGTDQQWSLIQFPWPIPPQSANVILLSHVYEHIPNVLRKQVLAEAYRSLAVGGRLVLEYPEFATCAQNWLDNARGQREFWAATIYGRGLDEWDRHLWPADTAEIKYLLRQVGIWTIVSEACPPPEQHNTRLFATKTRHVEAGYEAALAADLEQYTLVEV